MHDAKRRVATDSEKRVPGNGNAARTGLPKRYCHRMDV
jgi:hypothetical protein